MIGFYATFPEQRQGIYKISFADYDIDNGVIKDIGEQFKETYCYKYYRRSSRFVSYKNVYYNNETSKLLNDEIKGTRFVPFHLQFKLLTLKSQEA